MSWLVRWEGKEYNSDDFTIADLGYVEKESGSPWSTANVFRDVDVARAFLAVTMRRSGMSEKDIDAALSSVTLRTMKNAFQWVDDDDDESGDQTEEPDPSAPPPDPTTPGS